MVLTVACSAVTCGPTVVIPDEAISFFRELTEVVSAEICFCCNFDCFCSAATCFASGLAAAEAAPAVPSNPATSKHIRTTRFILFPSSFLDPTSLGAASNKLLTAPSRRYVRCGDGFQAPRPVRGPHRRPFGSTRWAEAALGARSAAPARERGRLGRHAPRPALG